MAIIIIIIIINIVANTVCFTIGEAKFIIHSIPVKVYSERRTNYICLNVCIK